MCSYLNISSIGIIINNFRAPKSIKYSNLFKSTTNLTPNFFLN